MGNGVYKNQKKTTNSTWQLQEAKACFSEVVRRSNDGPQTVTVHGKPSAVVISADYFERMRPKSGSGLIDLMAKMPLDAVDFGERGEVMAVRDVVL